MEGYHTQPMEKKDRTTFGSLIPDSHHPFTENRTRQESKYFAYYL
jgi:hypothetical protein